MKLNFGALAALLGPLFAALNMPALPPAFNLLRPATPPRKRRSKRIRYWLGLLQPQRMRDRERMHKLHKLRDEHGAFTLVGRPAVPGEPRRKWLAGISAQRGY